MTALGLDLGGTKLLAGVVEADGTVLATERRLIGGLPLEALLDVVHEVVQILGPSLPVGVGVPALVDQRSGVAVRSVHLPLDGVRVAEVLGERLGVAVTVDNDATCATVAECKLGAASGYDHVALLTLGTGIGGGLILDGRVYRGAVGAAGELGHVPVDLDGPALLRRLPRPRLPGGAVLGVGPAARRRCAGGARGRAGRARGTRRRAVTSSGWGPILAPVSPASP